jgi:hypothetical protein
METFIFALICYGACNCIIYASLFEGFRTFLSTFGTGPYSLHKLFTCFICLGFWMGVAITVILNYFGYPNLTPMGSLGVNNLYLMIFFNGLFSSAVTWLVHTFQETLERAFSK